MTIREARKEQRESIKNRSLKEKFSYFWEYHGIKTICLILAAISLIAFIVNMITQKEYGFTGVFFGVSTQDSDSYLADFAREAGIDPEVYQFAVQCHPDIRMDQQITPEIYQYMETFTAMVSAKSVDCFGGNAELFLYYAYMEYAVDLRTVLTPAELEALSPYLHYIDKSLILQQEASEEGYATAYSQHPDSTKPELMADPIPVAVSLEAASQSFHNAYTFVEGSVIGICVTSGHPENALAFFRYCLDLSQ